MKIETIEIHNFKVLQNVVINNIGSIAVFLGENGVGKSTLFDVFGFMKTCLTENVRSALQARGGYDEVHSRDSTGDIQLIFKYRVSPENPLFTYDLQICLNEKNESVIKYEALKYDYSGKDLYSFARKNTMVTITKNRVQLDNKIMADQVLTMSSPDILALSVIGQMAEYQAAVEFRRFIEDWFVSEFQINQARSTQDVSYNERLNRNGDNLANVAQFLHDQYPKEFKAILKKMQDRIPGVTKVDAKTTEEGRILLKFSDGRFKDPFAARYVSDGTIKMFAYLVMLADPNPHLLLCIEEPENQLYPHLLEVLAEEFKNYTHKGGQVFISTHSPDLVNALEPQELYFIKKQISGYSEIKSVSENALVVNLFKEGDKLGYLWKEGVLGESK
ncbi:ATPase [Spirochaetia bacterium]|nr:ATPase [Spirochaetia bacterium]